MPATSVEPFNASRRTKTNGPRSVCSRGPSAFIGERRSSLRFGADAFRLRTRRVVAVDRLVVAERRLVEELLAVERVQVLVAEDLEARRVALHRDAPRPREEEVPEAVPTLAVGREDLLLRRDPVLVPLLDGDGVVN